ncbi:MAG: hypothetical protein JWM59_1775 [Verrucomicrobiales bacterium]|nr:hypothetical protein [Verrucomicrobiales bacterium]
MGVFYAPTSEIPLGQLGAPFVIASGSGSQRGVAVAANSSFGFLVAWHEESGSVIDGTYLSSVRAALVSREGVVTPPGGRLLDISVGEISAVTVSDSGWVAWKYPQNLATPGVTSIRGALFPSLFYWIKYSRISPPEHNAVSPQLISLGGETLAAWRDKKTGQIFASSSSSGFSKITLVSGPDYENARQPALARLSADCAAIFWLGDEATKVRMATLDVEGNASPSVLVLQGYFDKDTLSASGDGMGKVAFSVIDKGADFPSLKVYAAVPFISRNGGLAITATDTQMRLSWEHNDFFPASSSTVETSTNLSEWEPLTAGFYSSLTESRYFLNFSKPTGEHNRFYRLRPVIFPGR